ncbi:MAG: DsbA family protein [bacterium]|nr:DsbA family protein [bacterium]
MEQNKNMLDQLPPRMAFWTGVLLTAGVAFALGFLILLTMMVKGVQVDFPGADSVKDTKKAAVVDKNDDGGTAEVAKAAPSGSIDPEKIRNIKGSGDITIVEYSDTECPFCKRYHETMTEVMSDYDGQVKWGYKHLPLKSLHQKAEREALASECAAEQGSFWDYIDLIFERTTSNDGLADTELFTMADDLSLDKDQFTDCLESEKYLDRVKEDSSEATSLGGQGTPFSVVIDNEGNILEEIPGALPASSIAEVLDKHL